MSETAQREFEIVPTVTEQALTPAGPMSFLQIAAQRGASPEEIGKWMELYERWEANEARKAFVEAMNAFKKSPPVIVKSKTATIRSKKGEGSSFSYKYAGLDSACEVIIKALSEQGISHRWTIDDSTPDLIRVTCVLTHEKGHSEETSMRGGVERSDFINPMQCRAVTVSYLERYTLLAAVGLAATEDTDGATANNGWLAKKLEEFGKCIDQQHLQKIFTEAFNQAKKEKAAQAMLLLVEARDKRKAELG